MTRTNLTPIVGLAVAAVLIVPEAEGQAAVGQAATTVDERLTELERKNAALEAQLEAYGEELERLNLRDVIPALGESLYGMGPAASKVYGVEQGLSIGGYGEFLFTERTGSGSDTFDALRSVLYFGYKFDEDWVFNSEIEFEHASTGADGEVSLEFGYIDYLASDSLNARGGLVLVPMGLVNERHEPTTFLPARRPQTERRIIPSTWRENGLGLFGDVGGFAYKAYAVNGFDGEGFDASGLRGGRQKGSKAKAEDFAFVGRLDWVDTPGLLLGGSLYYGDSGQDEPGIPDLATTILELHAEYETGPWSFRALAAMAHVDDAGDFNDATGETLARRLEGFYAEVGYDILADRSQSLTPFVRWETIDTQASMPSGFNADSDQDDDIVTFGLTYQPIDQVVIKLDYEDWDGSGDQWNFLIGYVF